MEGSWMTRHKKEMLPYKGHTNEKQTTQNLRKLKN